MIKEGIKMKKLALDSEKSLSHNDFESDHSIKKFEF